MAKTNRVVMKFTDFVEQYDDEIKEFAYETIWGNKEEYFDGYTRFTDEDYPEVLEEHWDEFVYSYAEEINILLEDDRN